MVDQPGRQPSASAAPLLVGREREQAVLRAALASSLAGRGSLVLVGRCYDLSETPPYGPWAEALARAPRTPDDHPPTPDLAGGAGGASQAALFVQVRDFLVGIAARRPLVLLLEDLHWADPVSLDLLRVAARDCADQPLLLLATYRADELAGDHPLAALLPLLVREARAARLDLRPLDKDAIGALVAARYPLGEADRERLVDYLAVRTEGNALFLGELLRTLEGEGTLGRVPRAEDQPGPGPPSGASPDSRGDWALGDLSAVPVPTLLRQVIAGRLRRLPPETERVLAVAAALGQEVPLALWATVAGIGVDGLLEHSERAVEARLLAEAPDGSGVRFAHALIRETLYAGASAARRRAWHRRAGEALVAAGSDPDAVADHFRRAGDPRAAAWLIHAGLRARTSGAARTAAARFVAAAGLLEGAGERGWLLLLGAQGLHAADTAAAMRHLDAAESLAQLAGDPALGAYIHDIRGHVLAQRGHDIRAGVAELERAVAAVEALPPAYRRWSAEEVALARVRVRLPEGERLPLPLRAGPLPAALHQRAAVARWYGFTGRYRAALALGEADVAATLDDDPAAWDIPARHGLAYACGALGRPAEARRAFALFRAQLYAQNDRYVVEYSIWAELQLVALPYAADDVPGRARLVAEATRAWADVRDLVFAAPYPSQAGLPVALLEGRWAAARRLAEAGVAHGTVGHAQGAGAALGQLARWQGDPEAAWARVRALHPTGPDTEPGGCLFIPGRALLALAAELALDAGDPATAAAWIAAHGRWLDRSGAVLWRAEHLLLRARHARIAGDLAAALGHAEAALAHATDPHQPLALLAARRLLGELDTAAGHLATAVAHLDQALALADACDAPYERALTVLALAELRAAGGDRSAARDALAEARAILVPLNATPAVARADALAPRLAPPAPPGMAAGAAMPFGLTAREAEVLRLLAAGLSTAQIAARLSRSTNTVNTHLRAIYGKLGVASRSAATRVALEHHLA